MHSWIVTQFYCLPHTHTQKEVEKISSLTFRSCKIVPRSDTKKKKKKKVFVHDKASNCTFLVSFKSLLRYLWQHQRRPLWFFNALLSGLNTDWSHKARCILAEAWNVNVNVIYHGNLVAFFLFWRPVKRTRLKPAEREQWGLTAKNRLQRS